MKGQILSYRRGRKTQTTNQLIIRVSSSETREKAKGLIGKKVTFTTSGKKKIQGEITRAHGGKGLVVARFEKGLPGQAFNKNVDIE